MNKREIAKTLVTTIVASVIGGVITKSLEATAPSTQKFKISAIAGSFGGWVVAEELTGRTDKMVDDFLDKRAKKIAQK